MIAINQLANILVKKQSSFFMIIGDEPLQAGEAADLIRQKAKQQGFDEREVFHVEHGFDWNQIKLSVASMSIFSDKKIIDIRIPSGKPGKEGAKVFAELCQQADKDNLILVTLGKMESSSMKTKWFKTVDSHATIIQVKPIDIANLPRWIEQRMKSRKLHPEKNVVELLSDRIEGNLLAAAQEIEKLQLLKGDNASITEEDINEMVANSFHFDIFALTDCILAGQINRIIKILGSIKSEGKIDVILVLWVVTREIRILIAIANQLHQKQNMSQIMKQQRVWGNKVQLVNQALNRHTFDSLYRLLNSCYRIDKMIKGELLGNPWNSMLQVCMVMAGVDVLRNT